MKNTRSQSTYFGYFYVCVCRFLLFCFARMIFFWENEQTEWNRQILAEFKVFVYALSFYFDKNIFKFHLLVINAIPIHRTYRHSSWFSAKLHSKLSLFGDSWKRNVYMHIFVAHLSIYLLLVFIVFTSRTGWPV